MRRKRAALLAVLLATAATPRAWAKVESGPIEARARVAVRNAFHHDAAESFEWVQERNELRLDARYRLIPRGKERLGFREAMAQMLYRGRYDSIFDIRDRYGERGYRRDDFRFPEGKIPRELFLDLRFAGALSPLSARIGRQQVVWGEADLFRSLDVVNPLRLDQNGILGDDFSDYREPLWIAKLLWSIGQLGPVSEAGLEVLYSPNGRPLTDRVVFGEEFRIKLANPLDGRNPRPNQLPFHRVRHPWELSRDGPYKTEVFDQAVLPPPLGNADVIHLNRNAIPTSALSFDASMAGARWLGKIGFGIDLTLNYLFKRSDLPGNALYFGDLFDRTIADDGSPNARPDKLAEAGAAELTPDLDGDGVPDGRENLINRCLEENEPVFIFDSLRGYPGNQVTACLRKTFWYPWTHVVGATLTYNEDEWTGLILRLEQSFSTKEARNGMRPAAGTRAGEFPTARDFDTNLMRVSQVWRSMAGFDSLRAFPWMPLTRYDPWFLTFQFLNEYYSHTDGHIGLTYSITDRMHHWNPLFTFLATGYFVNSRLRPILAAAYDVNDTFPVFWLQAEYFLTSRWSFRIGEVLYAGSGLAESFVFLNDYADRDTLFVEVAYELL
ncbi:MAG: DUF1302 family protein [Candidatus Binatia bacterium]